METNDLLIITVPIITLVVSTLKKIEAIPVTSKNAKLTALILATAAVLVQSYTTGQLSIENAPQVATNVVVLTGLAIGLYEAIKNLRK